MKIEKKKISDNECLLYFPSPLPINGTFYLKKDISTANILLNNIYRTDLAQELLLTADFLYIKAITNETMEDLELIALAEIDDYYTSDLPLQEADNNFINDKIKIILKTVIAPFLQKDGGDIEFIAYKDAVLDVRFLGKCQSCPYAQRTLQGHVSKNLIHYLPQIKEVKLS